MKTRKHQHGSFLNVSHKPVTSFKTLVAIAFFFLVGTQRLWEKHGGFFGCATVDRLRSGAVRQETRNLGATTAGRLVANLGMKCKGQGLRPAFTFRSWINLHFYPPEHGRVRRHVFNRTLNLRLLDAETTTHTGVFRADVWLLPFLNVYGLVGETAGDTRPAVVFPDNGRILESTVDYSRFSYGGGMTLAGGFKSLFITLDGNYTTGPIVSSQKGQVGDKPIESFTFAPRFGILISSGWFGTGAVWVGGMCLIATSEIQDRIDLSQRQVLAHLIGKDSLAFSVHVEPKDQWNLLIGGNWEISKRWSLTAEVGGIRDRFHVISAVMWRF